MRASIYNAMPLEGVQALVDYMRSSRRRPTTGHEPTPWHDTLPELRVLIDALDNELLQPAEPPCRIGQRGGRNQTLRRLCRLPPRSGEAQVIHDLAARQRRRRSRTSSVAADLARNHVRLPARWKHRNAWLYLGPKGTFSEEAALRFFGSSITARCPAPTLTRCSTRPLLAAAEFGVVPVENSTEGVVTRSLDLLLNSPLHIVGEISLLVRHHLLRTTASLDGVEVVLATRKPWRNASSGSAPTCPMPSGAPSPAMPRAHAWRPPTLLGRALRANVRAPSSACTQRHMPSRTRPSTAPVLSWCACPACCRRRRHRARTAPAWWFRCPTSQARSTTCWCP